MAKIALNAYTVRKDKNSTAYKTMPAYEAKVMIHLFGRENVELVDSAVTHADLDVEAEEDRLIQSYGAPVIYKVFGEEPGRIQELAEDEAEKAANPTKAKAKGKAKADDADDAQA